MRERKYPAHGVVLSKFFKNHYLKQWSGADFEILETATINREHYIAIRKRSANLIFVVVALLEREGEMIVVQETKNFEGPAYYNCPEKILTLLPPPTSEQDRRWREKCFSRLRLKDLAVGTVIEFPHMLHMNGMEGKIFEMKSVHPYEFRALDGTMKGRHVKIDRWVERSPTVRHEVLKLDAKRRRARMIDKVKE